MEIPTDYAEDVKNLFEWSLNYDYGQRPFNLFLDIIGWSEENIGSPQYTDPVVGGIGYMEAGYLARALREWSNYPSNVEEWITNLMACEG